MIKTIVHVSAVHPAAEWNSKLLDTPYLEVTNADGKFSIFDARYGCSRDYESLSACVYGLLYDHGYSAIELISHNRD